MPYAVQYISTCDAPGLAEAMMSAWWQDEHWKVLWAKSNMSLEQIISDCNSGEIVAYSRYILPDTQTEIWPEAQISETNSEELAEYERKFKSVTDNGRIRGMDYAFASEFGNPLAEVEEKILKDSGSCFAVDYMTTHPAHQHHGVASMMLNQALRVVDEAGLKSIVMASPAGQRLYEEYGFQFVRTLVQDDSR
ncbi:hypothetical protein BOTNAR_0244g00070 [Botryotinia narcissicola]|uniref:N-acetyltransferase domain-containing protein n=1 Tax=Botryotinia narcissicola TaxID=278944 RepID=A0A4Z1I1G5_9HELO|nr:hypothetical protein BOTNAR_0244g00070 [Botryotinia narcissicola]